jgi:3-hydroxybutyryl-CoA dehydrogenase
MKSVLVIGAGVMGLGIAQIVSQKGLNVVLKDINYEIVKQGIEKINDRFKRLHGKGYISSTELENCLNRINIYQNGKIYNLDLVIEAVFEDIILKKKVINEIEDLCSKETIIASNTTSLSITELSTVLKNPDRFIGMHFFNPVWAMQLIEIIPGMFTSQQTIETIKLFSKYIGKISVLVKESVGGIVSRILGSLINEAIFVYAEGVASAEDIDTAMKLGSNLPIGPLHLADLIGLDIHLAKMESLYREFGDSKYRPHPLLRKMVRGKCLGKKTGKGFFVYS